MPDPIRFQGVSVIPINREGKILLQQRDDRPDLAYPSCWTTFGGSVEAGETPDEAIHREMLEEIELDLPVTLWKTFEFTIERDGKLVNGDAFIYVAPIDMPQEAIRLNEGQALGYFSRNDLATLKIGFDFEPMFHEIFDALEKGAIPNIFQRPRTVSAFLRNREGKAIAQLRDDKPGLMFPNCWSTLGGAIEEGETPDEAVRRELMEEIEFSEPVTFWRLFEHHFTLGEQSLEVDVYAYVGEIDRPTADIPLHEGQRIEYISAADVDRLPFAFGLDHLFREFFATHDYRTGSDL